MRFFCGPHLQSLELVTIVADLKNDHEFAKELLFKIQPKVKGPCMMKIFEDDVILILDGDQTSLLTEMFPVDEVKYEYI